MKKSKFSVRFKELKKELKISEKKLGEKLGVSDATICRWENGVSDIKSEDLYKVAEFFKVSADYLIGLED